jgi:hypothetical protein
MEFFAANTNIIEWEFPVSTCKTDAFSLFTKHETQKSVKMDTDIGINQEKDLFHLTLPAKSK